MASDLRSLVLVLARAALVFWSVMMALVAVGSLAAGPAPFVLIAFGAAALLPLVVRRHAPIVLALIAVGAAFVPTWMLATYGESEGGVSGTGDVVATFFVLAGLSSGATAVGYGLGRIVWAPGR